MALNQTSIQFLPPDVDDSLETAPYTNKNSKYAPGISPANMKKIIQDAMVKCGVDDADIQEEGPYTPHKIRRSKRYIEVKGFAWFSCPNAQNHRWPEEHHRWSSARSYCVIDLKKQEICQQDKQKCSECGSIASAEYTTWLMKKMAQYVVKEYLIKTRKFSPRNGGVEDTRGRLREGKRKKKGKQRRLRQRCQNEISQ